MFPSLMLYLLLSSSQKRPKYEINRKVTYDELERLVVTGFFTPGIKWLPNPLINADDNKLQMQGYFGSITYIPAGKFNVEVQDDVLVSAEFADIELIEHALIDSEIPEDTVSVSAEFSDIELVENFYVKAYGDGQLSMSGYFSQPITIIKTPDME